MIWSTNFNLKRISSSSRFSLQMSILSLSFHYFLFCFSLVHLTNQTIISLFYFIIYIFFHTTFHNSIIVLYLYFFCSIIPLFYFIIYIFHTSFHNSIILLEISTIFLFYLPINTTNTITNINNDGPRKKVEGAKKKILQLYNTSNLIIFYFLSLKISEIKHNLEKNKITLKLTNSKLK